VTGKEFRTSITGVENVEKVDPEKGFESGFNFGKVAFKFKVARKKKELGPPGGRVSFGRGRGTRQTR